MRSRSPVSEKIGQHRPKAHPGKEQHVVLILIGVLLSVQVASLLLSRSANLDIAQQTTDARIDAVAQVFDQAMLADQHAAYVGSRAVSSDFGLRETVMLNDRATTDSMLLNHGERVGAEFVVVVANNGEVLGTTAPKAIDSARFSAFVAEQRDNGTETHFLAAFDDEVFNVFALPLHVPELPA